MKKNHANIIACILCFIITVLMVDLYYNFFPSEIFNDIFPVFLSALITFTAYSLYCYTSHIIHKKTIKPTSKIIVAIQIIYISAIILLLFFRSADYVSVLPYNFTLMFNNPWYVLDLTDPITIFNIIIFMPVPFLFKNKFKSLIAFVLFFVIEWAQMKFGVGSFDINDIVFYTVGLIIAIIIKGLIDFYYYKKKQKNSN